MALTKKKKENSKESFAKVKWEKTGEKSNHLTQYVACTAMVRNGCAWTHAYTYMRIATYIYKCTMRRNQWQNGKLSIATENVHKLKSIESRQIHTIFSIFFRNMQK